MGEQGRLQKLQQHRGLDRSGLGPDDNHDDYEDHDYDDDGAVDVKNEYVKDNESENDEEAAAAARPGPIQTCA